MLETIMFVVNIIKCLNEYWHNTTNMQTPFSGIIFNFLT